jgi:hypothetical protein
MPRFIRPHRSASVVASTEIAALFWLSLHLPAKSHDDVLRQTPSVAQQAAMRQDLGRALRRLQPQPGKLILAAFGDAASSARVRHARLPIQASRQVGATRGRRRVESTRSSNQPTWRMPSATHGHPARLGHRPAHPAGLVNPGGPPGRAASRRGLPVRRSLSPVASAARPCPEAPARNASTM